MIQRNGDYGHLKMTRWVQRQLNLSTQGRGTIEITQKVNEIVADSVMNIGTAHVFLKHTSASMMLCENADPTVLSDMETIMGRLVPDGDPAYSHNYEGDDDMAAHIRSVLTTNDVTIPISNKRLDLGTWQGLFLFEHRYEPHSRTVVVTLSGA